MQETAAVTAATADPDPGAPRSGITDELLAACVHCGFCVPVCPTWDLLREENDSPRGRLYLMRAESEGRMSAGGAFAVHLGRCLGCRACESVCPAGVAFGDLLERTRALIPRRPAARRRDRWVLELLTGQRPSRPTYAIARFLRMTGVASALGHGLPGRAGQLMRLLAATRPAPDLAIESGDAVPPSPEILDVGRDSRRPPRTDATTYSLLTGCVMNGLFAHVHAASRRTLAKVGFEEVEVQEQGCCGALHAHAGLRDEALERARRNIEVFERADCDWIVANSAGCGAALRDYPAWLADEPDWRERAEKLAERVRDVTEVLAEAVRSVASLDFARTETPRLEGRVGYDAPCHLQHAQGVVAEPLEVLRTIPGLQVTALPSSDRCCGGAGLYNLTHTDMARAIRAPKLAEVRSGEFDWVASGNPGCIMYLGAGLSQAGDRTPVVHPVELVDRAWS